MELNNLEKSVVISALNLLWQDNIERNCPKIIRNDLNKYHRWCNIEEKDKMSDLYYIQSIRKKLIQTTATQTEEEV